MKIFKYPLPGKHFTVRLLFGAVCTSLIVMCSSCWLTRKMIFLPDHSQKIPHIAGGRVVEVQSDSRQAFGYLTQRGPVLVAIMHGNGRAMYNEDRLARRLANQNISSLLIEYPGYGLASAYSPNETDIYTDASNLIEYVQKEYNFSKAKTTLWGYSLGTGVATYLVTKGLGRSVVLVAPYTSIPDVAEFHYIHFIPQLLIWDRFNSISRSDGIRQPVLIIHGTQDKTIPIAMGRTMHASIKGSALREIQGAGHNDIYTRMHTRHWDEIYHLIRSGHLISR